MSVRTLFVTGTDTGIGKTRLAVALLHGLRTAGYTAAGYKPVASGCQSTANGLRNADALALQRASSGGWAYDAINPYAFAPAIAPHIAAADAGVTIDAAVLDAGHARLAAASDWVVIEGAGGWHVPLSSQRDIADWVGAHAWPTLLVVGMRLGCINHAVLAARAIAARAPLVGWIANTLPPVQPRLQANIDTIQTALGAPPLARIAPHPPSGLRLNPQPWLAAGAASC